MSNRIRVTVTVCCVIVIGVIAFISERNPIQPNHEPDYEKTQELVIGEIVQPTDNLWIQVVKPSFVYSLYPFGTATGANMVYSPKESEKNCLGILRLTIRSLSDNVNISEKFSAGIITPKGKFYAGNDAVATDSGRMPKPEVHLIRSKESKTVYFYSAIPQSVVEKGGIFQFVFYVDDVKYTVPFNSDNFEPMLEFGDVLQGQDYRVALVATRQGDTIPTSNNPDAYLSHDKNSPYKGFAEIIADVTNLSGIQTNVLFTMDCRRVLDNGIEGMSCSSIMESADMKCFEPMGLAGAPSGNTDQITYYGAGAIDKSEIPPGETRRIHFFFNTDQSEDYLVRIHVGDTEGYVIIPISE